MPDDVQFGDVFFDESFLFARRADTAFKFTRAERSLLLLFTANVRRVLTREQLLDAVAGAGSDVSDRNIDYLINRLRAKLGDSARAPSLIATQYGEGYVWIADPPGKQRIDDALLLIGPVFGLDHLRSAPGARAFLARLQTALKAQAADEQSIAVDEGWSAERSAASRVRFSLDVSFYDDDVHLHCAMVLREAATRQMLRTLRLLLDHKCIPVQEPDIETIAASLKDAMWQQATVGQDRLAGPADAPLELRMHEAARLFLNSSESWKEMGEQLVRARRDRPDDPETGLMWAMHLHARLVQTPAEIDHRAAIEREIEALVFDHLPAFQDNPVFLLGASKLLLCAGRGHLALAEQLAERVFASSTAFAAAFSVLGQIKACKGEIEAAVGLYDRGLELAGGDTEFRVFLLVLKCAALLAAGDRAALDRTCGVLYPLRPATRLQVGLSVTPPGPLPPELVGLLGRFDAGRARQAILYLHYNFARLFVREDHRENVMRGLIGHLASRFGPEVVPDEVRRSVPRLMSAPGG